MIKTIREAYNQSFTQEKYQQFLVGIAATHNHRPPFRIAETPIFIPNPLKEKLIQACEDINATICQPNFKELTKEAIKHPSLQVPNEDYHTLFLQMDFGICKNEKGEPFPQLIEIQGFPSLYFFQDMLSKAYKQHFDIPDNLSVHLNGYTTATYIELLRKVIVGDHDPKNVVLLELEPEKQATYIDFLATQHHLGIKVLCISKLKKEGKKLYYLDENGKKIAVEKIYNRVIFDELNQRTDIQREYYFKDEVDIEWVGHPNWFFRISKYTMPLLKSPYVPKSYYLHTLEQYPTDLENYVLKPLYSFAGSGVQLDVDKAMLNDIKDPENFILQEKVNYEPVVQTPNEPVKCEIRMLMIWDKAAGKPIIVNNLVRLSKGKMIGVRYNKDKDWVGASVGFFERD